MWRGVLDEHEDGARLWSKQANEMGLAGRVKIANEAFIIFGGCLRAARKSSFFLDIRPGGRRISGRDGVHCFSG